jgi:flavin-dependent dehydrogenase
MTPETVDLAIIGGGPAGLAAAATAAALGASVVLLDEQASPGGQIYRSITSAPPQRIATLGPDYAAGAVLTSAFAASGARCRIWPVRFPSGARC